MRYKQTLLGAGWAIIQPLMTMVVFTIFFGHLAKVPSDGLPYPVFSLMALVPWTYFASALAGCSTSLSGNQHIISKVYFPRLIIPIARGAGAARRFRDRLRHADRLHGLVPHRARRRRLSGCRAVLLALATAAGVGVWLSALNVQYRDVRYVVPFIVQFWMFATPVAYPASLVPARWRAVYGLNPMAGVIEGFRWALAGGPRAGRHHAGLGRRRRRADCRRRDLLPPAGRHVRRRDLMTHAAIRAEHLGKRYRIGHRARSRTARDAMAGAASRLHQVPAVRRVEARADGRHVLGARRRVVRRGRRARSSASSAATAPASRTLLKVLSQITEPTTGFVDVTGRVGSLLEVGTGFHPD